MLIKIKRKEVNKDSSREDILSDMKRLLQEIYPDRWDIIEYPTTQRDTLTIYFPEIEITNQFDEKYTITDLYFSWDYGFMSSKYVIINYKLKGKRSSFTEKEYYYKYNHSHLSGWNKQTQQESNYCMGDSSFGENMKDLILGYNPLLFEALLYDLNNLIRWESYEGGAYKYFKDIDNIYISNANIVGNSILHQDYISFIDKNDTVETSLNINNEETVSIQINDNFINKVTDIATYFNEEDIDLEQKKRDILSSQEISGYYTENPVLIFRNEKINLKIIRPDDTYKKETKNREGRKARNEIIQYIAGELSKEISTFAYTRIDEQRKSCLM